jgi:hypothetical protein
MMVVITAGGKNMKRVALIAFFLILVSIFYPKSFPTLRPATFRWPDERSGAETTSGFDEW